MAGSKEHFTPSSRSKNTDNSLGAWEATADWRRRASSLRGVSRPCWKKIHGQLKIAKTSCNMRRPWLNGMEKGEHNKRRKLQTVQQAWRFKEMKMEEVAASNVESGGEESLHATGTQNAKSEIEGRPRTWNTAGRKEKDKGARETMKRKSGLKYGWN
ncbi:hypothetical protein LR48_Vigan05g036400 [Vigna angularis]|uniref:Uncharacterized protein n=1 Tax=Phaseolus angularis TaxID=3914 RepID=A0A0L9UIN7_PHAAN|nr:hypothetical protein LR48_Vigan05g036400 [Vigna angularis]